MADDFTDLLKINGLKRTHAEAALNKVLNKVREFETQREAIQTRIQAAKNKLELDAKTSDFTISLSDMGVFEQWELAQIAQMKILSEKIRGLEPELKDLKAALKILIVREDTLSALAKTAQIERRQAFDDKTAEATQTLWITSLHKKGKA